MSPLMSSPTQVKTGNFPVVTAGTAVPGPNQPCAGGAVISCDPDQTGKLAIGSAATVVYSTLVGVGAKLVPGGSFSFGPAELENLSQLWFDASLSGTRVFYIAYP